MRVRRHAEIDTRSSLRAFVSQRSFLLRIAASTHKHQPLRLNRRRTSNFVAIVVLSFVCFQRPSGPPVLTALFAPATKEVAAVREPHSPVDRLGENVVREQNA